MPLDQSDAGTSTKAGVVNVPALGFSFTANLGDARQLVVQTHVPFDAPMAEINAALDKAAAAMDRQKARYEIEHLQDKLDLEEATLQKQRDNMAHLDADHDKKVAELKVQIETLQEDHKNAHEEGYNQHVNSGRAGAFVPKGALHSRLERIKDTIAQIGEQIKKAEAERDQAHANAAINDAAFEKSLARLRGEIEKRRALIGG